MMPITRRLVQFAATTLLIGGCSQMAHDDHAAPSRKPEALTLAPGAEYQPLLTGKPQTCGMRSGRVVLTDNECNDLHTTGRHEETLVILAGSGQVRCTGYDPIPAQAGQIVYIPPDTQHQVFADPGVELRYVYVVAPIRDD
jgi:mannose-6-phosphate isomerase-like protein (cupin superfamily)